MRPPSRWIRERRMQRPQTPPLLATAVLALLLFPAMCGAAPLPKAGRLALVLHASGKGETSPASVAEAEDTIRKGLIASGYIVVDEAKLERIRRDKAAMLALEGDAEAILKLGAQYGVSTFVKGAVAVHPSRKNDANLYTATAVITVKAYSASAKYVFSDTVEGREAGYTPQDAQHRALVSAATSMRQSLLDGKAVTPHGPPQRNRLRLVVRNIASFQQANAILETCKTAQGAMSAAMKGYEGGSVTIEVDFFGDAGRLRAALLDRGAPLSFGRIAGTTLEAAYQ